MHSHYLPPTAALLLLAMLPCSLAAAVDGRPWWSDYHTLISHSTAKEGHEWELGMMAERGAWPTGWYGAWWIQRQLERRGKYDGLKHVEHFRDAGVKNVFYFDAGEFGQFVVLARGDRILYDQWELRFHRGETGRLAWFGKDGFYRDENPFALKNYRDFGLRGWTLPDGTPVENVFDLARRSFDSQRDPWDYSSVRVSPEIAERLDLESFLQSGPDPVPSEQQGSLGRICSYDHSNPFLLDDFKAGVGMMLTWKPSFLHFDNYFDNQLIYPGSQAFGPWSLENFRRFLESELDDDELQELGIKEVESFDLKVYISEKPFRSRGLAWHSHNPQWHDDPVWNLFVCSKLADSDRLFRELYAYCHAESRRQGSEVMVVGNTIPIFPGGSLVSGAIDIVHFEHHAAVQYGPLVVPTGLPPLGRLGGLTRLAAAIGSTGYCWPSVYVPESLSGPGHENLHKVLAMDGLANRGVLDYNHQYLQGFSPGSDESAAWVNCFIKTFSAYYGSRTPMADVALVFPGQTLAANTSVFTMDPKPALHDYLGWAQALTDLHTQWDALPDDQIRLDRLRQFRAVVLPNAACLSDEVIAALREYTEEGGGVILSGEVGTRHGIRRFLWRRADEEMLAAQLSEEAVVVTDSPGRTYYEDVEDGQRSDGRAEIARAIDQVLAGAAVRLTTDAPVTVGVFAYHGPNHALAVDLVNYDVDPPTDRLVPAEQVTLVVRPPAGKRFAGSRVALISPELRQAVEPTASEEQASGDKPLTPWRYHRLQLDGRLGPDGSIELTVPPFSVFRTISIPLREAANP